MGKYKPEDGWTWANIFCSSAHHRWELKASRQNLGAEEVRAPVGTRKAKLSNLGLARGSRCWRDCSTKQTPNTLAAHLDAATSGQMTKVAGIHLGMTETEEKETTRDMQDQEDSPRKHHQAPSQAVGPFARWIREAPP